VTVYGIACEGVSGAVDGLALMWVRGEQKLNTTQPVSVRRTITVMSQETKLKRSVLVVDDESMVREVVCAYLEREGFTTIEAIDGRSALECVDAYTPDLIVLDVMLPKLDGYTVLSELRKHTQVPVILLTARADEVDRVLGLELGADDYVVKPFSPRELAARVRSVLRRSAPTQPSAEVLDFGDIKIDGRTREVFCGGQQVEMPPMEFDLLTYLASSPRQVFTRGQILEQVWGSSSEWQDPSTVTVHIRRLRQKIEENADDPQIILTVWGRGYRFEP
jgi:DNA-binding response OmpR family regulator